jgi:hypothetical protein
MGALVRHILNLSGRNLSVDLFFGRASVTSVVASARLPKDPTEAEHLDESPNFSVFRKLKLMNCARTGNRAGLFCGAPGMGIDLEVEVLS